MIVCSIAVINIEERESVLFTGHLDVSQSVLCSEALITYIYYHILRTLVVLSCQVHWSKCCDNQGNGPVSSVLVKTTSVCQGGAEITVEKRWKSCHALRTYLPDADCPFFDSVSWSLDLCKANSSPGDKKAAGITKNAIYSSTLQRASQTIWRQLRKKGFQTMRSTKSVTLKHIHYARTHTHTQLCT